MGGKSEKTTSQKRGTTPSSTGPFSDENIAQAIERVASQSTQALRSIRAKALDHDVSALVAAIDAELVARPVEVDGDAAARNAAWEVEATGKTLGDSVRYAFGTALPASEDERRLLPILAANPGIGYAAWVTAYGKKDLSLAMGHLVHDRYGCFRHLREDGEDQSSILIRKETLNGRKHFWLRSEPEAVLRELGVI